MKQTNKIKNFEYISNCCSVRMNTDYGICPACKEHCEVLTVRLEDRQRDEINDRRNY